MGMVVCDLPNLRRGGVAFAGAHNDGRAGVPDLGTNASNKKIVPKYLDEIPGSYCPVKDAKGWDHTNQINKGWNGFGCNQLNLSGNNLVSLFDKAYVGAVAPGAKNLAYDYLFALRDKKVAEGMPSDAAWGYVNKILPKDKGTTQENCVKNNPGNCSRPTTKQYYENSFKEGGYNQYDDPSSALMFDAINRCGCVIQMNVQTNAALLDDGADKESLGAANGGTGCNAAAQVACAEPSTNTTRSDSTWGPGHQYNLSFQDLAAVCLHWWNTLVNDTYNKKQGITDRNDDNYVQICSTNANVAKKDECKVCGFPCKQVSFIGPGIILYKDKQYEYKADSQTCPEAKAKIDIVAQ